MKIFRIIAIMFVLAGLFTFSGCEEEVLDKEPKTSFSEKDIWADFELTKMYVWNAYKALGAWGIGRMSVTNYLTSPLAGASDQAYGFHNASSLRTYMRGEMNPDDMDPFDALWEDHYATIKDINEFFVNIDDVEADEDEKTRLKGEMKFIRAYVYHELANIWGGVPLIKEPFTLNDDFNVPRNSYKECVDYIVKELDEALSMVPKTVPSSEWGRVTKGAVLALKSRTLLYAASKLHDSGTEPSGPLFNYDKANKWQEVSNAAKAVMDLNLYSLVEVNDWEEYQRMFLSNNEEVIFAKAHNPEHNHGASEYPDRLFRPAGFAAGWSYNQPIQNFVDDFQMEDGLSMEESPLYGPTVDSMYANREWRFYANIFYNGAPFDPPLTSPRPGEVEYFLPGGRDGIDGPQSWNATLTGYNQRKYTDETFDGSKGLNSTTPYFYFRLAEIYLNYAEAQYHLDNEEIARNYVNMIRNRVNLPDVNSSGQELLEDIRHERKIELCFENHRFWDARRWMIAEDVFSEDAVGIEWQKLDEEGDLDPNGELSFKYFTVEERNFVERQYYLPIPRSEIQKSDLQQNMGYN